MDGPRVADSYLFEPILLGASPIPIVALAAVLLLVQHVGGLAPALYTRLDERAAGRGRGKAPRLNYLDEDVFVEKIPLPTTTSCRVA